MTTTESRRPPISRKSMAGQALFVVVLLLIARFLWMREQPERLMHSPIGYYRISGDTLYLENAGMIGAQNLSGQGEPAIQAQSIHGGGMRMIVKEDAHYRFYNLGSPNDFGLAEGKIVYAVEPRPTKLPPAMENVLAPEPGQFLGTFLPQPTGPQGKGTVGQKRKPLRPTDLPAMDVRFRQVSAQGGSPQDVAPFLHAGTCLVGNHAFWIRSGPEEMVQVTRKQGTQDPTYWTEVTAHSDLMLTSLTDGATRCLRRGILRDTSLTTEESGVVWTEPAPFPGHPTAFYARVSDGSVRSLGILAEENQTLGPIVEVGSRLYWTNIVRYPIQLGILMRANLDGTDVHEVFSQRENHPGDVRILHAYRGSLYCCLSGSPKTTRGYAPRNRYLCRLRPERTDPLEILHKLPDNSTNYQFDGGYLYFVWREQKRSLWASLVNEEAGAEILDTLCRLPLDP